MKDAVATIKRASHDKVSFKIFATSKGIFYKFWIKREYHFIRNIFLCFFEVLLVKLHHRVNINWTIRLFCLKTLRHITVTKWTFNQSFVIFSKYIYLCVYKYIKRAQHESLRNTFKNLLILKEREFLQWRSGLRIRLQLLPLLWRSQFDPPPSRFCLATAASLDSGPGPGTSRCHKQPKKRKKKRKH